jgi:hypothetical protein
MTPEEYDVFFENLLSRFGASLSTPSGFGEDQNQLYFSCTRPPILIPVANSLTNSQRDKIVARAKIQYGY